MKLKQQWVDSSADAVSFILSTIPRLLWRIRVWVNHKVAGVYWCIMLHLLWLKGGELKKNKEWPAGLSKAAGREETEKLSYT